MKVVRVNKDYLAVDLYDTQQGAAYDAGMSRYKFGRVLRSRGLVEVGGYVYLYPNER